MRVRINFLFPRRRNRRGDRLTLEAPAPKIVISTKPEARGEIPCIRAATRETVRPSRDAKILGLSQTDPAASPTWDLSAALALLAPVEMTILQKGAPARAAEGCLTGTAGILAGLRVRTNFLIRAYSPLL